VIRVVVVDDHAIVRSGLGELLANYPDIEVVGNAADGQEAIDVCHRLQPDVVLMDLDMPVMDGTAATRRITAGAEIKVVVLTTFSDRYRIVQALDAGAIGYLLKDAEPTQIVEGVRAAAGEGSPLDPRAARTLLRERIERAPGEELTERERDVLMLLANGLSNKQIGRRLGIAEKTVKAHLSNVFRTIGVADRTQAALWAERNGLARRQGI
jgi:DNA-binding NarL/FixJ family response regulator